MIINHNLPGQNAINSLNANSKSAQNSMAKLSSGSRINKAADDAAGLSISQKMQAQINGLDKATSNAQDSISLLQTAEGGLNETQSILQRMSELATQAANDTNVTNDRTAVTNELATLADEIDHIANSTNFNGNNLLSSTGTLTFQIGATSNAYDQITIGLTNISIGSAVLSVNAANVSVGNSTSATASISIINAAIQTVSAARSKIGAYQNRLDHTINNLTTESQNLTTAMSGITDVDMAKEMMNYSKENVLQQAAQSMLAQANQNPQQILKLLQ
ncbi:flagellin N-terminal helical domain-containing protein [Clostridium hydrogenum]|uniref:flagellin N-terminal helical domain-containing protein n=1 Tax=Clostridium hydrogenum TaxID=2855764 RepID=UPI001F261AD5|nr:flagellin [Clostridium hydrogenum]